MYSISSKLNEGVLTVFLEGRIDSVNAALVEKEILDLDNADKLIIDLEKLEYISSAGLRIMLKLRKNHEDLSLINASTEVYEIFDMTGFTEMIDISRAYKKISIDGCEVIGEGANGLVYRTNSDTVIKVYKNPDSLQDIKHEREVAKKALILGVPTAISYDIVKVGDCYASMFELLDSKSLCELLIENPDKISDYVRINVDLLKTIHETEVEEGELPSIKADILEKLSGIKEYLGDNIFDKSYKLISEIPDSKNMIHGDFHLKNIMMQNGEAILIDMDTLAYGHPIFEFAFIYRAYAGFSLINHENVFNFLGIRYEVSYKFLKDTFALYFNTNSDEETELYLNKAKFICLIMLIRRFLRRNDEESAKFYKEELIKLIDSLDSLV